MPAEVWTRGLVGMLLCERPQGCTLAVFIEAFFTFGEPLFSGVNSSILNRSRSLSGHALLVNALGRSSGVSSGRASPTILLLVNALVGRPQSTVSSRERFVFAPLFRILPLESETMNSPRKSRGLSAAGFSPSSSLYLLV